MARGRAEELTWLVDPKEARMAYWMVHAMGAVQLLGAGALVIYGGSIGELVLSGLLLLSGILFVAVAGILGAPRGGAAFCPHNGALRVMGRSASDVLEIPSSEILGLRVIRRQEFWGRESEPVFVCSVEVGCRSGVSILLLELSNLEDAQDVALTFREVSGWDILTESEDGSAGAKQPLSGPGVVEAVSGAGVVWRVQPGVRYALSLVTVSLGLLSLVTGILLLAAVEATGVAGFLFGPFLGALGICCGLLWLFHVVGAQKLEVIHGQAVFAWGLGGLTLGRVELRWNRKGRVRLKTRGALGFVLELVHENRMVTVGAGSTCGSAVPPEALLRLASRLLAERAE